MEELSKYAAIFPFILAITAISVGGWVLTTWLRIKNGYPLQNAWGMALHPKKDEETGERIRLLTTENAQLRAELGSIKDRLETVERIVTDKGLETAEQIEALFLRWTAASGEPMPSDLTPHLPRAEARRPDRSAVMP